MCPVNARSRSLTPHAFTLRPLVASAPSPARDPLRDSKIRARLALALRASRATPLTHTATAFTARRPLSSLVLAATAAFLVALPVSMRAQAYCSPATDPTSSASAASCPAMASNTPRTRFPTVFLTHGGGPSYFMEVPPSHPFFPISAKSANAQWLRDFMKTNKLDGENTPKAIVVVSAHWETRGQVVRISDQAKHSKLNYDYGGFPPHTYQLQFNPPGDPKLSRRIASLLTEAGIKAELDTKWNFDHGVFVPLKMIVPEATIPVVEVSIDDSWEPEFHLKVGRALRALKDEGVLLIGSGSSTHNFNPDGKANAQFMAALTRVVEDKTLSVEEREKVAVLDWAKLPSARKAHPAEDHFVPFFVVIGAAHEQKGKAVGKVEPAGDWSMGSFLFE